MTKMGFLRGIINTINTKVDTIITSINTVCVPALTILYNAVVVIGTNIITIITNLATVRTELTFQQQSDAVLNQTSPEQNTWYTVLDTTNNISLIATHIAIITTGETLDAKITMDGKVYTITGIIATAATDIVIYFLSDYTGRYITSTSTSTFDKLIGYAKVPLEARSVKMEVRKTTANGTGNLRAAVTYAKR